MRDVETIGCKSLSAIVTAWHYKIPQLHKASNISGKHKDSLRIGKSTMTEKKKIFVIIGSASQNSANQKLVDNFASLTKDNFNLTIFNDLKTLPHFDPKLSTDNSPTIITEFRNAIENADGILICTPEYIFSIPSGLKNAIEWCVSTTVFSDKPIGLITASASGQKGHEELQMIMKTVMTNFTDETTLLIQGIKGKINDKGEIIDSKTKDDLLRFIKAYKTLIKNACP
ncbi:MAG TPA: NADPH-dependent FMN reductase [Chitinophagaceae bacterium]|nr:NADPH-dependent FMN reductase [Chitinophagaceae bacterium]